MVIGKLVYKSYKYDQLSVWLPNQRCNRVTTADPDTNPGQTRIPIRVRPGFDPDVTRIKKNWGVR